MLGITASSSRQLGTSNTFESEGRCEVGQWRPPAGSTPYLGPDLRDAPFRLVSDEPFAPESTIVGLWWTNLATDLVLVSGSRLG